MRILLLVLTAALALTTTIALAKPPQIHTGCYWNGQWLNTGAIVCKSKYRLMRCTGGNRWVGAGNCH
jgi:hypothetical protein